MKDVKKADIKDIQKFVHEKREEVRKFRFTLSGAGTKNVKLSRNVRKEIARAMTELTLRKKQKVA